MTFNLLKDKSVGHTANAFNMFKSSQHSRYWRDCHVALVLTMYTNIINQKAQNVTMTLRLKVN